MSTLTHPGDALSKRQKLVYIVVLGLLTALAPFTIDLYLPAFPILQQDLEVSTAAVQLTLTATIIGFAAGQLVVGPLSDKVGRRLPLIIATAVHVLASIGAAMSTDITMLLIFRVLQGIGAAGGGVVAMAMVRDLFSGYPLVRMMSRLALVTGMAPIVAPLIGAQLLTFMSWPGIFWVLSGYGLLVLIAAMFLIVETLPAAQRTSETSTLARYRALFSDRIFVGILILGGFNFAGLFSYLSASPFIFQGIYGLSPQQYGLLFALNSIAVVIGVQVSARILRRVGPQWVIAVATVVQFAMALLIVLFDQLGLGFFGTLVPLWFYVLASGFIFPCVQVIALANHGAQAGTAASLLGAVTFGFAGLISPVVGALGTSTATPMGIIMAACIGLGILSLWFIVQPKKVPAL